LPDPAYSKGGAVLITRPHAAGEATAKLVAALGLRPVLAPVLEISSSAARLPSAAGLQAVLVASANALPALPPSYHRLKLLAVGNATADRARAAGFRQVHSAAGDVSDIVALTLAQCDPAGLPLLLAAGRDRGADPTPTLQSRGFTVIRRAVYAAVPVAALPEAARTALAEHSVRAALFFSPATARAFVHLLPLALPRDCTAGVEALAISRATEAALAPLPWRRIRVASRPNQDELLALLQ
jgi:uroporphyrinogen-III synthase